MVQVSVTPFQYNPVSKTLTVIQDVDLELVESGETELPHIPQKNLVNLKSFTDHLLLIILQL